MQKYDEALNELREISDESTGNIVAFNNMLVVQLYLQDGKYDKSLSFFEKMISVNPNRYCNEYATANYSRINGLLNKINESKKEVLKVLLTIGHSKAKMQKRILQTIIPHNTINNLNY